MYLSYSGYKYLRDCALRYWFAYVGQPDLGKEENAVNTLYGSIVSSLIEDFYERELWRSRDPKPRKLVMDLVDETVQRVIDEESNKKGRYIEFDGEGSNYASREELEADVRDTVPRALGAIRFHRLLGPMARAEIKLDSEVDGHKLGGRVDFMIRRAKPLCDKVILDGKGSKKRAVRYLDWDQLLWYGVLHRERFGKAPDKLGYFLWRFSPQDALMWLDFDEGKLDAFKAKVMGIIAQTAAWLEETDGQGIEQVKKTFKPKPSQQNCRFCTFATQDLCPRGAAVVKKLEARRRAAPHGAV